MTEYTLYCFAQSGNAYKAASMLNHAGADWTARFVDFFNGETRTSEYREINVMGEVPVLEHDGRRLTQTGVILDYLAERLGRFGWNDGDERREIMRWILWDNHKLTGHTAVYRFLRQFTKDPDPAVMKFLRDRGEAAWAVLDALLEYREFAVSDRPTIADFSMSGYLFFDDEIGVDWASDYPNIHAWLARIRSLDGWRHPYDLMPGYPLPADA